ncbi:(2Fe-2S)-binding protein [Streptomyces sp. BH-SS-21]|uniref:Bacterioferritin-associated ferredoxin n=1 Tax=Streptomyces liliiviolaceus TaxID=2823109 RepID=A0A940XU75_9ACTN|nr:(2Fe-2S)-binding protein [Streptomyces liliiviolaceus]MBQ0849668.1 (2Fe-2S)-binding protein [Streptomyces liliiviolaceus]
MARPTNPVGRWNRVFVCNCFGVTEAQVKKHAADGACTPRQIASACKAGTDCGSCVRRIQALLGRGALPGRDAAKRDMPALVEAGRREGRLDEAA